VNWNAIGAVAELLGAVGVVASLLYVAAQVRQSARESRVAAGESAVRSFRELLIPINSNPALLDIWNGMFTNPGIYDGPDGDQALHLMFQAMKASESLHFHHHLGLLDEGTWRGWEALLVHHFNTRGFQRYWELRRDIFSPAFRAFVRENTLHTHGRVPGQMSDALEADSVD
jgi:hypothetical protein